METKKKHKVEEEVSPLAETSWDKLVASWRANPKRWIRNLLIVAILATAALVVNNQWTSAANRRHAEFLEDLSAAQSETDRAYAVERMEALRQDALDLDNGPFFFMALTRACVSAGDEVEKQEDQVRFFEKALAVLGEFEERYPNSPMLKLPWKPNAPGTPTKPSVVAGLRDYCQKQIAFLRANPFEKDTEFDPKLIAHIELEDDTGERHSLKLRFFSKMAPYSVDTVCRLAKEGWFNGSLLYGLEREQQGAVGQEGSVDELVGFHMGSGMTKASPEDNSLWGDMQKDRVGFTIPEEKSHLMPVRGRVALEFLNGAQASSPVRLVVYTQDSGLASEDSALARYPRNRTVFAEVEDGDALLDKILTQEAVSDPPIMLTGPHRLARLEKPWKIVTFSVEGEATTKPDKPILTKPRLPEPPPKKEEPEDKDPDKAPSDDKAPKGDKVGKGAPDKPGEVKDPDKKSTDPDKAKDPDKK